MAKTPKIVEQVFGVRFLKECFDWDSFLPGCIIYFHGTEKEWASIQNHFAKTYEPWDIYEDDYWMYLKFREAGACIT